MSKNPSSTLAEHTSRSSTPATNHSGSCKYANSDMTLRLDHLPRILVYVLIGICLGSALLSPSFATAQECAKGVGGFVPLACFDKSDKLKELFLLLAIWLILNLINPDLLKLKVEPKTPTASQQLSDQAGF